MKIEIKSQEMCQITYLAKLNTTLFKIYIWIILIHRTQIVGFHIEGPFIAKSQKGAHTEAYIKEFGDNPLDMLDKV